MCPAVLPPWARLRRRDLSSTVPPWARLGLPARPEGMNIIVRTPAGPASLLVDRIGDVLECDPARWSPPPDTLPTALRGLVVGSYHFPDRLLLVLDADDFGRIIADFPQAEADLRRIATSRR